MKARVLCAVGAALLCGACGQDAPPPAGSPAPASPHADAGDPNRMGDPNATFDSAGSIALGSRGVFDFVDGREDKDFFSFEGRSGQYVEIRTTSLDPISVADTRITLFDEQHIKLAYNDYVKSLRGENVLARIVTRLPADGTYFVEVNDPNAPPISAGFAESYHLTVTDLSTEADGFTVEPDGNPAAATVSFHEWQIDAITVDDSFLVGSFSDATEVDRFSFTVGPGDLKTLSAEVQESGPTANGSTTTAGKVWLTDESGTAIIARIDNTVGQSFLAPPLGPGNYALSVSHPDGPLGTNDFYVVRAMVGPENPPEAAESTNGTIALAEPLETVSVSGQDQAFVVDYVLDKDVDYFRFDGQSGQTASVYCDSAESGSGLVGLHVSVRDETDRVLGEQTEIASSPSVEGSTVALEGIAIPAKGSLYIRTGKDAQLPDVTGNWARCAVYAQ